MKKYLIFYFFFLYHFIGVSQTKKIGYSQIAIDIFLNNKEEINYKNIEFVNDLPNKGAEVFITSYSYPEGPIKIYGGFKEYLELIKVPKDSTGKFYSNCKKIIFEECTFENDIRFSNINFNGIVSFVNNNFPNKSEDYVGIYGQLFGGALLIDSCSFIGFELLERIENSYRFFLKFNNSIVSDYFSVELQKSTSELKKSTFKSNYNIIQIHKESILKIDSCIYNQLFIETYDIDFLTISNCVINNSSKDFSNIYAHAEDIEIKNNIFDSNIKIYLIDGKYYIADNQINKELALSISEIKKNSYIDLGSLKNLDFGIYRKDEYYNATSKNQIKDDIGFKKYLRINKTLYDFFKDAGDIKSANSCFVRIKEIENNKLKFIYDDNPSFQNFFSLYLNRLLKFYTNYGTDPSRALVVSVYIILIFAVLYFFFPSDWDITSKTKLISNFKDFVEKNDKGYIKPFLFLIYGLLISSINAIMLSLNAFTTLGFGNIPTHGIGRYICILQGFIGWFLLSVFTVALFNQTQY